MSEVWEQQEGESNKQYRAFCDYLDMGEGRSLAKLFTEYQRRLRGDPSVTLPVKTLRGLEQWSSAHDWVNRVKAYDAYMFELEREARETARLQSQADIVEAEYADYHMLRQKWLEIADKTLPVSITQETRGGDKTVITLRTEPHRLRALVGARQQISAGLRLAAEMPDKIERREQTSKDGGDLFDTVLKILNGGSDNGGE